MERFGWLPAQGASVSVKPKVAAITFGDGYEQRVGHGINNRARKWSLKFVKYVYDVRVFLERHNGLSSFMWTDPLGLSGVYVCREWRQVHLGSNRYELTCEFEQVFE